MARVPVEHVEATIGPIELRHFQSERRGGDWIGDEFVDLPEAVLGRCEVVFWFGRRRRTKVLRAAMRWTTPTGWSRADSVSASEVRRAQESVAGVIRDQLREHGISIGAPLEAIVVDRQTGDVIRSFAVGADPEPAS